MKAARWCAQDSNRCDFAQEGEEAATALAGEGCWFGELGRGLTDASQHGADAQAGLAGGGAEEAVVANAS